MASHLQSDRTTVEPRAMDMKDKGEKPEKTRDAGAERPKGDALIARNLKLVYDEIAAEPLPPELAALLTKLDSEDASS